MTDYPAGTRLRVTFVGTINDDGTLQLPRSRHRWIPCHWFTDAEQVEVIEPDWQSGDVVLDANGTVFRRRGDGAWLLPGHKDDWHSPARPLTLIARDGKPATA